MRIGAREVALVAATRRLVPVLIDRERDRNTKHALLLTLHGLLQGQ